MLVAARCALPQSQGRESVPKREAMATDGVREREVTLCMVEYRGCVHAARVQHAQFRAGRHTISLSDRRSWLFQFSSWLFAKSGSCNSRGHQAGTLLGLRYIESVAGALTDRLLTYSLAGPQPPALGKG